MDWLERVLWPSAVVLYSLAWVVESLIPRAFRFEAGFVLWAALVFGAARAALVLEDKGMRNSALVAAAFGFWLLVTVPIAFILGASP